MPPKACLMKDIRPKENKIKGEKMTGQEEIRKTKRGRDASSRAEGKREETLG